MGISWKPSWPQVFAGIVAFAIVGTGLVNSNWHGSDVRVRANWPLKVGWSSDSSLAISVTDDEGDPLEGQRVELGYVPIDDKPLPYYLANNYQQFRSIDETLTGDGGVAKLTIPALESMRDEFELPNSNQITFLLRVESDALPAVLFRTFFIPPAANVSLQMDRSHYEPGDTVRLRALAMNDAETGLYEPADEDVDPTATLELETPSDRVVAQKEIDFGRNGVATGTFELESYSFAGNYTAVVRLAGDVERRTFVVQHAPDNARRESPPKQNQTSQLQVSLWPEDQSHFRSGQVNEAVAQIRDASGQPVADARVKVTDYGLEEPVATDLQTDAHGRLRFDWKVRPDYTTSDFNDETDKFFRDKASANLTFDITAAKRPKQTETVEVPVVEGDALLIEPETPFPKAGETLHFQLRLPATENLANIPEKLPVVALHEKRTVAATEVSIPNEPSPEKRISGQITLGRDARGLTHLLVLPHSSTTADWPRGWSALWVRQRHSPRVDMTVPDGTIRPGGEATVGLEFPSDRAKDGKRDVGTTFGLWAVDEKLYELQKATDVPLASLLDEPIHAARAARRLGADASDPGPAATARFNTVVGGPSAGIVPTSQKLHPELERNRRRRWGLLWGLVLVAIMLGLTIHASRLVWQYADRSLFAGRRLGIALAATLLLPASLVLLVLWTQRPDLGLGLLLIAGLFLLGSHIDTHRKAPQLQFGFWGAICSLQVILAATLLTATNAAVTLLCGIVVFSPLLAHCLLWALVFMRRTSWRALAGPAAWSVMISGVLFTVYTFASALVTPPRKRQEMAYSSRKSARESAHILGGREQADPAPTQNVRQRMKEAMIWRPEIEGDDGEATVQIELPATPATWRLISTAHTTTGAVGSGTAILEVEE